MPAVNRADNFSGRVNYAAAVISSGRRTSRTFDSCFENNDGSEVAVAVYRRSLKNPKIAANIFRYLAKEITMDDVERLKAVSTRDLAKSAAESRARSKRQFDEMMARRDE